MGADHSLDKIVFFDGVCNLCNSSVQFLIRHNTKSDLKFASLQSEFSKKLLSQYTLTTIGDSILYLKNGKIFFRSDAIIELLKELDGIYPYLVFVKFCPRFFRNKLYDFVARKRYQWFGKRAECWIPTPELKSRFIS